MPYSNETICRIIFELTGQDKSRKHVSSHFQLLKSIPNMLDPAVDSIREDIIDHVRNLHNENQNRLISNLGRIRKELNALVRVLEENRRRAADRAVPHFSFRFTGTYCIDYMSDIIKCDGDIPSHNLSLMRVSHFYRTECFAILAPKMIYDFGSDVEALHDFSKAISPALLNSITQVRVTLVEGHMLPLPSVPGLQMLYIDLWPRDPARSDSGRAWGEQTETLLTSLQMWVGVLKVRLEMRWRDDCERFEREYVTNGLWVRVLEDGREDQSSGNEDLCHRFYEL